MPDNDRNRILNKLEQSINHAQYIIDYMVETRVYFENGITIVERNLLRGHDNPQPHVALAAREQAEERYRKYLNAIEVVMQQEQLVIDILTKFKQGV